MKIYLGADHGGYAAKEQLKKWLQANHYDFEDCGAFQLDPEDDYPDFSFPAAEKVAQDSLHEARGILSCRSSGGAVIAANKVRGIRAVSVFDQTSARHAREHNDANIIGVSGDWSTSEQIQEIVKTFLTTPFSQEPRHLRRIQKITQYEEAEHTV